MIDRVIDLPGMKITNIQGSKPNPSADCYKRFDKASGVRVVSMEQLAALEIAPNARVEQRETRQRKPRRPNLTTMVRQAEKAGLTVHAVTATADGGLNVQVGEPEAKPAIDLDNWLAKRGRNAGSS